MEKIHHENKDIKLYAYNAVINCWAQGMHEDSGVKAEGWLDKMEDMYSLGENRMKPDHITYASVINAYAAIGKGADAERVLKRHIDAFKRGVVDNPPGVVSYGSTIHGYAKCGKADDAERVLKEMEELSGSKNAFSVKPNVECYNAVINAYAKSGGGRREYDRVMEILDKMNQNDMSDTLTYSTVVNFLSGIDEAWAENKAIGILDEMWNLFQGGNRNVKPNTGE